MSSASGEHGQNDSELVFLYALEALPSSERAVVEAHISTCADCRQAMETLRPIIDTFVFWPTDVLRIGIALGTCSRSESRRETDAEPVIASPAAIGGAGMEGSGPRISCKLLATDTEKQSRQHAGANRTGNDYPRTAMPGFEELYRLQGESSSTTKGFIPATYRQGEARRGRSSCLRRDRLYVLLITSLNESDPSRQFHAGHLARRLACSSRCSLMGARTTRRLRTSRGRATDRGTFDGWPPAPDEIGETLGGIRQGPVL